MKTKQIYFFVLIMLSFCGCKKDSVFNDISNVLDDTKMLIINNSSYEVSVEFDGAHRATIKSNGDSFIDLSRSYNYPYYVTTHLWSNDGWSIVKEWHWEDYTFSEDYWYKMIITNNKCTLERYLR